MGNAQLKKSSPLTLDQHFCTRLEYAISRALTTTQNADWQGFWCDGVLPDDRLTHTVKVTNIKYHVKKPLINAHFGTILRHAILATRAYLHDMSQVVCGAIPCLALKLHINQRFLNKRRC